jgi:hypothetical protein
MVSKRSLRSFYEILSKLLHLISDFVSIFYVSWHIWIYFFTEDLLSNRLLISSLQKVLNLLPILFL